MLAFTKFAELQTVRQVHLWMRQERLPLPATEYGPEGRKVVWKLPVYNTLHHLLTNPIYAGAYVFGRTGSRIDHRGRPQADCARLPQGSHRLGGFDPRPPRGLY